MLNTRSRVINFRVTEDEFTRLSEASLEIGARCLSDFARTAIMIGLETYHSNARGQGNGKGELQALGLRLGIVELTVAKLERMMSTLASDQPQHLSREPSI